MSTTLYTKAQTQNILRAWGVDCDVPAKGKQEFVVWPGEYAIVSWTDKKSDYGDRLYGIEFVRQQ